MAENDDGESAREEGDQRIVDLALQAGYKGSGKGKWSLGKGLSFERKKVLRWQRRQRVETHGKRAVAGKEAKDKRKMAMEKTRACRTCGKTGHTAAWCRKGGNKNCTPLMKMTVKTLKKQLTMRKICEHGCLSEESETEQWQEAISRREKQKVKKSNQAS